MKTKKPTNYVTVEGLEYSYEVFIVVGKDRFVHSTKVYRHYKRAVTAARKTSEATGLPFVEAPL